MSTLGARTEVSARPLEGRRIVLTRDRSQAGDFEARILALGGEPVLAPAIAIGPPESWTIVDAALRRVETYDWIAFTSANAVRALIDRADVIGVARDIIAGRRLAVVGPATASALAAALRAPDVVSSAQRADALGREISDVDSARILFPRGDLAGGALAAALRGRGAFVDDVITYRTTPGDGVPAIVSLVRHGRVDALLFASPSAVQFVAEALGGVPRDVAIVCIGPVTADAACAAGFEPAIVSEHATQDDLIEGVVRWFAATGAASQDR
jgi:uroporphyrinogen-III synthase